MSKQIRFFSVAVILFVSIAVARSAETEVPKKIRSVEGITEYSLSNGMKVLLFPDASKPTVTVNLTIFVGSRHEGYGEAGMAHLLEHMLFKGTPDHPKVPKLLQDRGAKFNGTTWLDRTNYYETLPASDGNLEFAIRLEADRMVNSYVKAEDLKSEMTVVRNEFERGENRPTSILFQRMMSAAYLWHNYGQSTIGNRADIERVPIDNLKAFYKKYYQPDNAMLVVAGKFDTEKALGYIAKYFGALEKSDGQRPKTYTEEPAQDGERFVTLRRVGDVSAVGAVYHIPSGAHPDYAPIDVLESILTASPSGKLYKALVETKRAASISGSAFALHDPGVLMLLAQVTSGNDPQVVLDTMLDIVEKLGDEGVTDEDVGRAKQRLLKYVEQADANSTRLAVQLSEWAAQGDWRLKFLYRDRLEKVTAADVKRVAKAYLQRNNRTVGMFLPIKKAERISVPATPELAEMIGDYKGRATVAEGEVFEVSPANIDKRTQFSTLPSGVKAALLPKKTRGEVVNLRLTLRYGNESNLRGYAAVADYLPSLMLKGTKKLNKQQIQDILDKNRASLSGSGSPGIVTFSIKSKKENLPAILELLHQVLREPTFPKEELEILKQGQLSSLEKQLTDPQAIATTTVSRQLNKYEKDDPRYVPTTQEEIDRTKAVSIDAVKKLYNNYLGANQGQLSAVGNFDLDQTVQSVNEMLANWKNEESYARIHRRADFKSKGKSIDINTPDKANSTYFAALSFPMLDSSPDYPALTIGNFILGAGSLSSRLGDRVRQKEGLSYGVGSGFRAGSTENRALFYVYAISNPDNVPKVKVAIQEELTKLIKDGVTEEELTAAKKGFLQRQEVSRTEDSSLASTLSGNLNADRTMSYYADLENRIQSLTTEDIQKTFKKYIDLKRLVIVAAGDFEKKSESEKKGTSKE